MRARRKHGASVEMELSRVLSVSMAVGAFIEVLAVVLLNRHQTPAGASTASGWCEVLALAFLVGVVGVGIRACWASLAQLRIAASVVVLGYLVLIVMWSPIGWSAFDAPGMVARLLAMPGPPVLAAAIAWGPWGARASFAATAALLLLNRIVAGDSVSDVVVRDTHTLIMAALLCFLGGGLVAAARELDQGRAAAIAGAARHADWLAHRAARTQMHAFLHDEVLSTLTSAARATDEMRPLVARKARHARRLMDELAGPADADSTVVVRQFVDQVGDLVARLDRDARLRAEVLDSEGVLDGEVVGAFLGALHQALANSLIHAGDGVRRTVHLVVDSAGVALAVLDDGRGFDPRRVPPSRMGVAVSILGRMRSLRGGAATVEAVPGGGTTVRLHWRREQPARMREKDRPAPLWDGSPLTFRLVCAAIAACQLGLGALLSTDDAGRWPLAIGGALALAVVLAGLPGPGRLSWVPTALVAATVLALTVFFAVGSITGLLGAGDAWCYNGRAVVLLLLCLRGRSVTAVALQLLCVLLDLAVPGLLGHSLGGVGLVLRPVTILVLGALIVLIVGRLQYRAAGVRSEELSTSATRAWNDRLRAELQRRSDELRPLVAPLLERIASGAELDVREVEHCVVVEGRLRDVFRGGRLARPALLDAGEAARRRGVDVVLVDAAPEEQLGERALSDIVGWIVAELAKAPDGSVVVRLHAQADRGLASVTTPRGTTTFGGWNGPADLTVLPTLDRSSDVSGSGDL